MIDPATYLAMARQAAKSKGLFIVEKIVDNQFIYIVYRECEPRNVRIGRRTSPHALYKLVNVA